MGHERKRILLVDDEPSMVMVTKKVVEIGGYEVIVAVDGREGLEKAYALKPDLIMLDVMLPKLNGYSMCALLKQDQLYRHIPIVMLSAKSQEEDRLMGMECGADAYIVKPYESRKLLEEIRTLLANGASEQNPKAGGP